MFSFIKKFLWVLLPFLLSTELCGCQLYVQYPEICFGSDLEKTLENQATNEKKEAYLLAHMDEFDCLKFKETYFVLSYKSINHEEGKLWLKPYALSPNATRFTVHSVSLIENSGKIIYDLKHLNLHVEQTSFIESKSYELMTYSTIEEWYAPGNALKLTIVVEAEGEVREISYDVIIQQITRLSYY